MSTVAKFYKDTTIVGNLTTKSSIDKLSVYEYCFNLPFANETTSRSYTGCVSFSVRSFKLIDGVPFSPETASAPSVGALLSILASAQRSQSSAEIRIPASGVFSRMYLTTIMQLRNRDLHLVLNDIIINLSTNNITFYGSGISYFAASAENADYVSNTSVS